MHTATKRYIAALCALGLLFSGCQKAALSGTPDKIPTGAQTANPSGGDSSQSKDPSGGAMPKQDEDMPGQNETAAGMEKGGIADGSSAVENASKSEAGSDSAREENSVVRVSIPEGYTLARIAMTLEEKGVCSQDAFLEAAQGELSQWPLLSEQAPSDQRCFQLEGYLFPDTYDFYVGEAPISVLNKFLDNMENRMDASLREEIAKSGYTTEEILTIASIIQKEALGHDSMPRISSVLHNRLNAGMQLQCDVTIAYVEGAVKPFITGDINRYNAFYNTYKCPALPAGPICNPGLDAIRAALSPADSQDLFFLTDQGGNYYYAETWQAHLENLDKARAVNKSLGQSPPSGIGGVNDSAPE